MAGEHAAWDDQRVETWVGLMLRTGVMLAAAVVLTGGILYMIQSHGVRSDYTKFHGEPERLISVTQILHGVASFDARSVIMLGLLILIATPVARVGMCIVGFLMERDRLYVAISSAVLLILLYSLVFHT